MITATKSKETKVNSNQLKIATAVGSYNVPTCSVHLQDLIPTLAGIKYTDK